MKPPSAIPTPTGVGPKPTSSPITIPASPVTLKKATGVKVSTDGLKNVLKNTPAGITRHVELLDVQEVVGTVTKRLRRTRSPKPGQIEVRHEFVLVDCFNNPVIKVRKGQTVEGVLESSNSFVRNKISHLIRITLERPAGHFLSSWLRTWKRKSFDTLTVPEGHSFKDFVARILNSAKQ